MHYSGFAAFLCCTLLLAACHTSAMPKSEMNEEKGFLMNLIERLAEEAEKMTNNDDTSELLVNVEADDKPCPDEPKCEAKIPMPYRWCTGIVLDTTNSMEPEIDLTKNILSTFLNDILKRNPGNTPDDVETPYCFAFVEVNNYQSTYDRVDMVATSDDHPKSLKSLITKVDRLTSKRGNHDTTSKKWKNKSEEDKQFFTHWEEQFQAIKDLQNKKRSDNKTPLMQDGQIIMITNSNTHKGEELGDQIANFANENNLCISMYVANYRNTNSKGPHYEKGNKLTDPNVEDFDYYKQLKDALTTKGVYQLDPKYFRHGNIARFFIERAGLQCGSDPQGPEAKQPIRQQDVHCGTVTVGQFSSILRVTAVPINKNDHVILTVTSPSGEKEVVNPIEVTKLNTKQIVKSEVTVFTKVNPRSGEWRFCSIRSFKLFTGDVPGIEITPAYNVYDPCEDSHVKSDPRPCASGKVQFCSNIELLHTKVDETSTELVIFNQVNGKEYSRQTLDVCNNAFYSSDFFYPSAGVYQLNLVGRDASGTDFKIDLGEVPINGRSPIIQVTTDQAEYTTKMDEPFEVVYTVENQVQYCVNVDIEMNTVDGFTFDKLSESSFILSGGEQKSITLSVTATRNTSNVAPLTFYQGGKMFRKNCGPEKPGIDVIVPNPLEECNLKEECGLLCADDHVCKVVKKCHDVQQCVPQDCIIYTECKKDCQGEFETCVFVRGEEECAVVPR